MPTPLPLPQNQHVNLYVEHVVLGVVLITKTLQTVQKTNHCYESVPVVY